MSFALRETRSLMCCWMRIKPTDARFHRQREKENVTLAVGFEREREETHVFWIVSRDAKELVERHGGRVCFPVHGLLSISSLIDHSA